MQRIGAKSSSLLLPAASAFSERYLGVPLRDDSRYQVCFFIYVYFLADLHLLKALTGAADPPTLPLSAIRVGGGFQPDHRQGGVFIVAA